MRANWRDAAWIVICLLAVTAIGCGPREPVASDADNPPAAPTIPPPAGQDNDITADDPSEGGDRHAPQPAEPAPQEEPDLVKAETGVGKKGRGYGGDMITAPVRTKFRVEQRLVFDVQIPKAMQVFKAIESRNPKSHEEFMERIINENAIKLPELPEGESYLYDPETAELMVARPKNP